jgi:hypothetical protein
MRMQTQVASRFDEKFSQPERTRRRQWQRTASLDKRVCFVTGDPDLLLKQGIIRLELVVTNRPISDG